MKAALNNLTVELAAELAPHGVRVNSVSPGPVLTDMQVGPGGLAEQTGQPVDRHIEEMEQAVPLGRLAAPEEIAGAIVALLSDRFSYMTGSHITIDGGIHAR